MDIELDRRWRLGEQFDSGGFGEIFEAEGQGGEPAVVKLIPKAPGTNRELLFVDLKDSINVVPVWDSGEWEDRWVIVMPRAEASLRHHLNEQATLTHEEAVGVLLDVSEALSSISSQVVHRDIKPENILLLDGHWCLADFGIARYAQAATSSETWKHARSAPYSSPEQWRDEHATSAVDIYALGVVAYELLAGDRPFQGPEVEDYRNQHLHSEPPALGEHVPPGLRSLVSDCLSKSSGARPSASRVVTRLRSLGSSSSPAAERLADVNARLAEEKAGEVARMSRERTEAERIEGLAADATASLQRIGAELYQAVAAAASITESPLSNPARWKVPLGDATLGLDGFHQPGQLADLRFPAPFQIVAYSAISVRIPRDTSAYEGRAHSLWYCDALEEGVFRWYETAFMASPMMQERFLVDPTALAPGEDSFGALSNVTTTRQVAWPFTPVDQGDEQPFVEQWIGWFADAAAGNLRLPRTMPERSVGTWRQSGK